MIFPIITIFCTHHHYLFQNISKNSSLTFPFSSHSPFPSGGSRPAHCNGLGPFLMVSRRLLYLHHDIHPIVRKGEAIRTKPPLSQSCQGAFLKPSTSRHGAHLMGHSSYKEDGKYRKARYCPK